MINQLNKSYWENRYTNNLIGWNIGYISTPLKTYIDQIKDKSLKILIPGAGNSYEAEYLCIRFCASTHRQFYKSPPTLPKKSTYKC